MPSLGNRLQSQCIHVGFSIANILMIKLVLLANEVSEFSSIYCFDRESECFL